MPEEVYFPGVSLLHHLDVRLKVAWSLGTLLALALIPAGLWAGYAGLFALLLALSILSEVPFQVWIKRLRWGGSFLVLTLPWLFYPSGTTFLYLGQWGRVTWEGLVHWLSLLAKLELSLWVVTLLTITTPPQALFNALRDLGVSEQLVTLFQLTWRYLFVMVEEGNCLLRARAARSGRSEKGNAPLRWQAQVTGGMIGNLFLRSLDRAERIHGAMLARGFDGSLRALESTRPLSARQKLGLMLSLALSFGLALGWIVIL